MESVGIANIPNQLHSVVSTSPFEFSLMCIGGAGLGKSTFVNALFATDIYTLSPYPTEAPRIPETKEVQKRSVDLVENGIQLKLTVFDTPGFGVSINNTECWDPLVNVLEEGHKQFMNHESRVARIKFSDCRVHCCLYFIAPSVRGLTELDITVMKRIQGLVNLIPVIGRADMLSPEERIVAKAKIRADLEDQGIEVCPLSDEQEDNEDDVDLDAEQEPTAPYLVSASIITETLPDGSLARVRRFPWGTMNASDSKHSDFTALRRLLLGTHTYTLIDRTNKVHYENYRKEQLSRLHGDEGYQDGTTPIAKFEALKRLEEENLKQIEKDLVSMVDKTAKEKATLLSELENQLLQEHETMQRELSNKQQNLADARRAFDEEQERCRAEAEAVVPPPPAGKRGKRLFK